MGAHVICGWLRLPGCVSEERAPKTPCEHHPPIVLVLR